VQIKASLATLLCVAQHNWHPDGLGLSGLQKSLILPVAFF
jgi:hypothetical protein